MKKYLGIRKLQGKDKVDEVVIANGGKYYAVRELGEGDIVKPLAYLKYKELLKQGRWELYSAVCYLCGFNRFSNGSYLHGAESGCNNACVKVKLFYPLLRKSVELGQIRIFGDIANYPKNVSSINSCLEGCYVEPYDFLKWAILKGIILPWEVQKITRLIQREVDDQFPYFFNGNKYEELRVTDVDRVTYQAIAEVLWSEDPLKNKSDIEWSIKENPLLHRLGKVSKYTGKHTFRNWLDLVDPREKKFRRGNPGKNERKKVPIKDRYFHDYIRIEEVGRYSGLAHQKIGFVESVDPLKLDYRFKILGL